MTDTQHTRDNAPPGYSEGHHHGANELEEYAGGYIEAWVGRIPPWLLAVYAILFRLGSLLRLHLLGRARAGTTALVKHRN